MAGRIVGTRLGSHSYENGDGPSKAKVNRARYRCVTAESHVTEVPFSAEATELPVVWHCSQCRGVAIADGVDPEVALGSLAGGALRNGKPVSGKTPWQHVRERRTLPELEAILAERLAILRGPLAGASVPTRTGARPVRRPVASA
jgi:hypothetical protein